VGTSSDGLTPQGSSPIHQRLEGGFMAAQSQSWPMIKQGIQLGKGAPCRLTLAPGRVTD
jgi:hypothetical protein